MVNDSKFKVLIIKPSSLGDIFHAYYAVNHLVNAKPEVQIDWLINPAFADILRYFPKINRIIPFERRKLGQISSFFTSFFDLYRAIRRDKYDLVIDFQGLFRSAFFAWIAKSNGVFGFAHPKEKIAALFYKHRIIIPDNCIHAVDKNLNMIKQILPVSAHITCDVPGIDSIFYSQAELLLSDAGISIDDEICGIVVGARWPSKCFPESIFAEMIKTLLKNKPQIKIVLLGTGEDLSVATRLSRQFTEFPGQVVSLVGKTGIGALVEVIRRCKMIISNDSGPVHIAALLNKTVFAFFGSTDPGKTGPYGSKHYIFELDLPCLHCLKRTCPNSNLICHNLDNKIITDKLINFLNQGDDK